MRNKRILVTIILILFVAILSLVACDVEEDNVELQVSESGKITVTFNCNGAKEIAPIILSEPGTIKRPIVASRRGYEFLGWYEDNSYTKEFDFSSTISKDTTLYAKWKALTVTITYDSMGGSEVEPQTILHSDNFTAPNMPIKKGCKFLGWYLDKEYTEIFNFSKLPLEDTTLYAKWKKNNPDEYTITLIGNGGEGQYINSYNVNEGTYLPTSWQKEGCVFLGWYEDKEFNGVPTLIILPKTTGDKVYYARWEAISYTVVLNDTDGSQYQTIEFLRGEEITLPTNYEKEGYTFGGWFDNPLGEGKRYVKLDRLSREKVHLYALWLEDECKLSFYPNNGEDEEVYLKEYGTTIHLAVPYKPNYTFVGWYRYSDFNGMAIPQEYVVKEKELSLYAKYKPIEYSVKFNGIGGVNSKGEEEFTLTYKYGEELQFPKMHRDGYNFVSWVNANAQKINSIPKGASGNFIIYAIWELGVYNVNFIDNIQGETIEGSKFTQYEYGTMTKLPTMKKEGYTFLGWYDNPEFKGEAIESIENDDFGDKTFYANYVKKEYTLRVNITDKLVQLKNIKHGEVIDIAEPKRNGYTFLGWYSDKELQVEYKMGDLMVGDLTIYTKWEGLPFTITFDSDGGSKVFPIKNKKCGEPINLVTPICPGWYFDGWFTEEGELFETKVMPCRDMLLKARWHELNDKNAFTITYEGNGGKGKGPKEYRETVGAILPQDWVKEGYRFGGWYDNPSLEGEAVTRVNTTDSGNKIYYAKWIISKFNIKYYILNDEDYEIGNYIYSEEDTPLMVPTRDGYDFKGWYLTKDRLGEPVVSIKAKTQENLTYYAKWTNATYTVTFTTNTQEKINNLQYTYGEELELPLPKERLGYVFMGWIYKNAEVVKITSSDFGNKDLVARWTAKEFAITYVGNGGNGEQKATYTYEKEEELPIWNYDGHEFKGWYFDEALTDGPFYKVPKDKINRITIYAKWEKGTYTIHYVGEGIQNKEQSYTYGEKVVLPTNLEREGYTFMGWYKSNLFLPNEKVEIVDSTDFGNKYFYANWKAHEFKIVYDSNLGTPVKEEIHFTDEKLTPPTNPTRSNYVFSGWYLDKDCTQIFNFEKMPPRDIELTAKWEEKAHLKYFSNGVIVKDVAYNPLEVATLMTDEEVTKQAFYNPDYIFLGWYLDETFKTECNSTIEMEKHHKVYAKWLHKGFFGYLEKFNRINERKDYRQMEINSREELVVFIDYIMYYYIATPIEIRLKYHLSPLTREWDEIVEYAFKRAATAGLNKLRCSSLPNGYYAVACACERDGEIDVRTPNPETMLKEKYVNGLVPVYTQKRAQDFNDFEIEKKIKGFPVYSSDQLFYVTQYGEKPDVAVNSPAERMYNEAKKILRTICDDSMSEFEKVYSIYLWMIQNVNYDYKAVSLFESKDITNHNNAEAWHMEGVFDRHWAVCDGMSKAFTLMCRIEGIPCIRVTNNEHAWNKVFIDLDGSGVREWYGVDTTWGNRNIGTGAANDMSHLLFTDSYKTELKGEEYVCFNHKDVIADTPVEPFRYVTFEYGGTTYDTLIESDLELDIAIQKAIENRTNLYPQAKAVTISIRCAYTNAQGQAIKVYNADSVVKAAYSRVSSKGGINSSLDKVEVYNPARNDPNSTANVNRTEMILVLEFK